MEAIGIFVRISWKRTGCEMPLNAGIPVAELVEHGAEGEQIGARIHVFAKSLFGGHVGQSAQRYVRGAYVFLSRGNGCGIGGVLLGSRRNLCRMPRVSPGRNPEF